MTPERTAHLMGLHLASELVRSRAADPAATLAEVADDLAAMIDARDATLRARDADRVRRLVLAGAWDAHEARSATLAAP